MRSIQDGGGIDNEKITGRENRNLQQLLTPFATCPLRLTQTTESTCLAYKSIKTIYTTLIKSAPDLEKGNLFGIALRLVFHDAAEIDLTKDSDKNGPDGCISSLPDNVGLTEIDSIIKTVFEPIWLQNCDKISRADFWVLMAILTVELSEPTNSINIHFQFGRSDKQSCDYTGKSRLPSSQRGLGGIQVCPPLVFLLTFCNPNSTRIVMWSDIV